MRKLSIIQLVSAREEWGGIEQHAKDLARGLKERGHSVCVVARPVEFVTKKYSEVCQVYTFPIRGSIDLQSVWGIAKVIQERDVDIVHTHTSRDAWTALFATMVAGRGKAVTTRHAPFPAKRDPVHTWFYNKLASIICVSKFVRDSFLGDKPASYANHTPVIYPGIDDSKFHHASGSRIRSELGITEQDFVTGFVGRITPEKGVHVLMRAAAILKERGKESKLVVVGMADPQYPQYVDELKEIARKGNIEATVHFYGFTSNVAEVLNSFNTLVLPAVSEESSPLVLREAMLCGKPAIATNSGGSLEIVDDGVNGYLVPPEDATAMADAVEKLLEDRNMAEQMGMAAAAKARATFTLGRMIDEIEKLYYKL